MCLTPQSVLAGEVGDRCGNVWRNLLSPGLPWSVTVTVEKAEVMVGAEGAECEVRLLTFALMVAYQWC